MKAAVLREFKTPLAIEEVERPAPEPEEVVIKVEACGVCHSDLHVADGDWPAFAKIVKKPLIPGHEVVGRVVEKGELVRDLQIGDRVGLGWIHWTCGACELCRGGNENLCPSQKITGVTVDGGYAEFVKAPASHVLRVPDSLSPAGLAPLFCAGVTVYRALRKSKLAANHRVSVFGIGGLGHLAVQIARRLGAEVIAVDISDEKLELAKSLGASGTVKATAKDAVRQLRGKGGAHVALVASASKAAYDMALATLRPTGMLLVVGLPAENICFPPLLVAGGEIQICASAVGTREDIRNVLAMAAQGQICCQVATRPLADANGILEELRRGQIAGRVVLVP
jgi:alcohol dehydrogenase, propanol-preferring